MSLREEFVKDLTKALEIEKYAKYYQEDCNQIKRDYEEMKSIVKEIVESGKIYHFQKKLLRKLLVKG